jgi:hypothetical protein
MKSGFYGTLGRLRGSNDFIDKDGNVWEEITLNGSSYLRKKKKTDDIVDVLNGDNNSATSQDFSKLKFSCDGSKVICDIKYKACSDAIYIPEDFKSFEEMAQSHGGSYKKYEQNGVAYYVFADGTIWKNVGLSRPVLCKEVKTATPDKIVNNEMPCCIQLNAQGQLIYFYKGKTYPAGKTTDGDYIADLGEGWRLIKDCVPVEPNKEPSPCDTYIKELSQLKESNSKLQNELNDIRSSSNSNNDSIIKNLQNEIDNLRAKNSELEKNLITDYDDNKLYDLKKSLTDAKDRNSELAKELELTKSGNGKELQSHLDYCCQCENDRCGYEDEYY